MVLTLHGLGQPPLLYEPKSSTIAQPNTTLAQVGKKVTWTCNDWMLWHKFLIKMFMSGKRNSQPLSKKYSQADATAAANQVFVQHWDQASFILTGCGYTEEFYRYFNEVGLASIFNISHRTKHAAIDKGSRLVDNATESFVNIAEDVGKAGEGVVSIVSNVTNVAKWVVPAIAVGVVSLVGLYVYKNYIAGNERVQYGSLKV